MLFRIDSKFSFKIIAGASVMVLACYEEKIRCSLAAPSRCADLLGSGNTCVKKNPSHGHEVEFSIAYF